AAPDALDGVHVHPALMRERGLAHPWRARVMAHVGDLIHEFGKLLEFAQRPRWNTAHAQLELEVRDDADEVAIARPLAVAVDRALHLRGACFDAGEGIGHAQAAIVVRVNANRATEPRTSQRGDLADLPGQAPAVGIARRWYRTTRCNPPPPSRRPARWPAHNPDGLRDRRNCARRRRTRSCR